MANEVDELAAERAMEQAEQEAMLAELKKRQAEEAKLAAEQDAALQAVRDACDAERAALEKLVTK